ncbi:unnamed protein product [Phyllotreta striolata]|uniref:Dynein intermediate chain 2, ciliary n=1 Tax=Phyllotreta striolata TaxID=444603 RepID=A0A9N9XQQ4_PHYSR|nr:unnamed protein product [Phyllotreta striolata]
MPNTAPKKAQSGVQAKKKEGNDADAEQYTRTRGLMKPKDQVELNAEQLREIFVLSLNSNNTQIPDSIVVWSYADLTFIPGPMAGNMVEVFTQKGSLLRKDSEEARQQMIEMGLDPAELDLESVEEEEEAALEDELMMEGEGEEAGEEGEIEEEGQGEGKKKEGEKEEDEEGEGEEAPTKPQKPKPGGRPKKLTNLFNFCERAALTYSNPSRPQETQTIPPPMATFSALVTPSLIYDIYMKDYERHEEEKERERREKMGMPPKHIIKKTPQQINDEFQAKLFKAARVLERMINQNTYFDIAKDYRYWDDPADDFKAEEGTVLPLWKFEYNKTKKHTVCDLEWNPYYYDLFAVCFGFLDYSKPVAGGALCLFTLKNPSFPDYVCMTDSAVMCVDTHKNYPYMVAIGLFDGSVRVYNVNYSCKEPVYKSNSVENKHRGIVWEVKWAEDTPDGELNFYSVGSDGKVNNWILMSSALTVITIIELLLDQPPVHGPDGTTLKLKASICCFKFHPVKPQIYMIGTEEGYIYKCSVAYSSAYLLKYEAHQMPVCQIDFNKFNTDIFISCSMDWRIKIWEDNRMEPLFVFDIGERIGDVKWAPYSSTVFACVTTEGKIHVYDLNVNKYKPICVQAIVSKKKNKTTKLAFNYNLPILVIGDDKGCSSIVKLSPNLRIPCRAPKKQQDLDQNTLQLMKLDKLLAVLREPTTLSLPPDTAEHDDD